MLRKPTITEMTFSSKGPFPMDMLRRDCCHPKTIEDAMAIEDSLLTAYGLSTRNEHAITLVRHDGLPFTLGRWESFGWKAAEKKEAANNTVHTPGHIHVSDQPSFADGCAALENDLDITLAHVELWDGMEENDRNQAQANLRRFIALWNMAETAQLSTDLIESGFISELINSSKRMFKVLEGIDFSSQSFTTYDNIPWKKWETLMNLIKETEHNEQAYDCSPFPSHERRED